MPGFQHSRVCRAPAEEVWKLLHDPGRYPEWWTGTDAVSSSRTGAIRHVGDETWPTDVIEVLQGQRVVISCVLTDILFRWTLDPHADGCRVTVDVAIPEDQAARLGMQTEAMADAIARLAGAAERAHAADL